MVCFSHPNPLQPNPIITAVVPTERPKHFVPYFVNTYYTTKIHKIKANISTIAIILCLYPDIRTCFSRPINYTNIILHCKFYISSPPTNPNEI
jgi:hypothetical protein